MADTSNNPDKSLVNCPVIKHKAFPIKTDPDMLRKFLSAAAKTFRMACLEGFHGLEYWRGIKESFDDEKPCYSIIIMNSAQGCGTTIKLLERFEKEEEPETNTLGHGLFYHHAAQILRFCFGVSNKGKSGSPALTERRFQQLALNIGLIFAYYQKYVLNNKACSREEEIQLKTDLFYIYEGTKNIYISDVSISSVIYTLLNKVRIHPTSY